MTSSSITGHVKTPDQLVFLRGGEGGIRTHGEFPHDGFQDRSLKPLGYLSVLNCHSARSWRRGRDSNPRATYAANTLAGCPFQPLRHLSTISGLSADIILDINKKIKYNIPSMPENEPITQEINPYGQTIIGWEVDEYTRHQRSVFWYIAITIIGVGLIIYALMTANFLFAVIILMFGIISFLSGMREPQRIEVVITNMGALIGPTFYPFKDLRNFSIVYEPPEVKTLYIDFHSGWRPFMSVSLEETDPNVVREALLPYVTEDLKRNDETLTDMLTRMYKL